MNTKNSLDIPFFQDELDFKTLENILETLDHVTPKKVSRSDFNALKWNFLVETGEDKLGKQYDLFLPDDLKIYELPAIISRINKITFWEILPDYASKEELKVKIAITINELLKVLNEGKIDDKTKKAIQRAITKYIKLYADMFWDIEAQRLNQLNYRQEIISKWEKTNNASRYKEYQSKLFSIRTKENLSNLSEEVESHITWEIKWHFQESFLERWVNMLRLGMMTITQAEQINLRKKWIWKWEDISFHISDKELDKNEKLLREKIGMTKLKKELDEVRKTWNQEKINQLELKATNTILKVIYEYPYQLTQNNHGYQPNKIAEFKEIYCVGFSLLWHAFLTELGIKHYWLQIPEHSALEVIIGTKSYYFDGTASSEVHEFTYWKRLGEYAEIVLKRLKFGKDIYAQRWNPEIILLSQIYNNKWSTIFNLWQYGEAIKLYDEALKLNPKHDEAYNNKWNALFSLWKYDEAIKIYHEALRLNPINDSAYNNKWNALFKQFKMKLSQLNIFASKLVKWEKQYVDILYRKEKSNIKQFINSKNFEWLRLYLLELEKEDN